MSDSQLVPNELDVLPIKFLSISRTDLENMTYY